MVPVIVFKFHGDRRVTARVVPRKDPEECAVNATAEDLQHSGKQHAVQTVRESVGSVDVVFEENGAAESQQNAGVEQAIWGGRNTARTLVHACPGVSPSELSSGPHSEHLCK